MSKRKRKRRDDRSEAIGLRVSPKLLTAIDEAAKVDQRTRSDWIHVALSLVLNLPPS